MSDSFLSSPVVDDGPTLDLVRACSATNGAALHGFLPEKLNKVTTRTFQDADRLLFRKRTTTPIKVGLVNESFSTCLLVMDENFRLYEWLAYHYHVLTLRYVVIAVDPGSVLSPEPVLGFVPE
jgi:hypothetical protein